MVPYLPLKQVTDVNRKIRQTCYEAVIKHTDEPTLLAWSDSSGTVVSIPHPVFLPVHTNWSMNLEMQSYFCCWIKMIKFQGRRTREGELDEHVFFCRVGLAFCHPSHQWSWTQLAQREASALKCQSWEGITVQPRSLFKHVSMIGCKKQLSSATSISWLPAKT